MSRVDQIFLRRLWLMDNMDLWLRESPYHKMYDAEEDRPRQLLWNISVTEEATVPLLGQHAPA